MAGLALLTGCAGSTSRKPPLEVFSDMDRQDKYKPQAAGPFFADGRASRRPVPGAVAVGHLRDDETFLTGVSANQYLGRNPLAIDRSALARGRQRFDIYCAVCHDRTGSGHGIVAQKSSWLPSNLNDDRIRNMPDGELFNVVSFGRRSMPPYRFQIDEHDRWRIVAYVRALQRASAGKLADVPVELRDDLR